MPHVVGVLQMFRQQLLVVDYSHLREACSEAPELQRSIDEWTADPAGHASKARATARLLAQPGEHRQNAHRPQLALGEGIPGLLSRGTTRQRLPPTALI